MKILLVHGANLTFLGRREPVIYGTTTAAELDAMLQRHAREHGYVLDIFYSNIEGEAINHIYRAVDEGFDGLVMNPAGFTYAGECAPRHGDLHTHRDGKGNLLFER